MKRPLVTTVAIVVACGLLAVGAYATTTAAQSESPTPIDSCTVVDEPGEYELADDVGGGQDACIEITTGDVTLHGNGRYVSGPGSDRSTEPAGVGVRVDTDDGAADVVVRNVRVQGWETGIHAVGGGPLVVESTSTVDNGDGVRSTGTGAVTLTNHTARANDGYGIVATESAGPVELANGDVMFNDAGGVHVGSTGRIVDSQIHANPTAGISVAGEAEIENIELGGNNDWELDAREGTVTASGLDVGDTTDVSFTGESVALEEASRRNHPSRDDGIAVGDGLNVTGTVDGPIEMELPVETGDDTVDVWRHDGTGWETVQEDLPVTDDAVEASVDRSGTFAAGIEEPAPREVDSCRDITEPGEYVLTEDLEGDGSAACLDVRTFDVVVDGNGHAVTGPGPAAAEEDGVGIFANDSDDLVVRNVEVSGWSRGLYSEGSEVTLEGTVVRENGQGLDLYETGDTTLTDVVIEDNEGTGIGTDRIRDVRGTNVTIRRNAAGIGTWDGRMITLESSRIVDNEGNGVSLHHYTSMTLIDVEVSGNGEAGISAFSSGFEVSLTMAGGSVTDNGDGGILANGNAIVDLDGVTVADNDGPEVDGYRGVAVAHEGGNLSATDLEVGPSATLEFQAESIALEPVDRDALPSRDRGTPAGDGLNVTGPVDGPIQLELDVDTDDDTVDLWRHDGTGWETVEEDLAVSGGTVEATVDRNGTYAPGAEADDSGGTGDDSDGSDDGDDTDSSDGTGDDSADDSDDSQDDPDDGSDPSDDDEMTSTPSDGDDETPTQAPSDADGEKDTPTPTPSDSDGEKKEKTETPTDSTGTPDCGCPASDDEATGEDESTPAGETTASPEDHQQADETEEEPGDTDAQADDADDGGSIADAPGFGPVLALVALLGSVLLIRRRE